MSVLPPLPHQKSKIGFYFHVPFCPHICPYCDFVKTSRFTRKDVEAYFQSMRRQLKKILDQFSNHPALLETTHCTVYFGGGTPSLFPKRYYEPFLQILSEKFELEEVSIETNPFTNKENFILDYAHLGVNRVTLGAQSLCEGTLKILGRRHTSQNILNNISWLKEAGIEQIQVDLIYGLKTKRSLSITEEVRTLIDAGATGISAYGLTIEARTVFGQAKKTKLADDEVAIREYSELLDICKTLGLQQIETSNFSFSPAKHNQIYWSGYPYFGVGTGAHGLLPQTEEHPYGQRYRVGDIFKEISPGNDKLIFREQNECDNNFKLLYESQRSKKDMLEELIFTLLRTKDGIPLTWLCTVLDCHKTRLRKKLKKLPAFKLAYEQRKILLSEHFLQISPQEKIRGDMWAGILIDLFTSQDYL